MCRSYSLVRKLVLEWAGQERMLSNGLLIMLFVTWLVILTSNSFLPLGFVEFAFLVCICLAWLIRACRIKFKSAS